MRFIKREVAITLPITFLKYVAGSNNKKDKVLKCSIIKESDKINFERRFNMRNIYQELIELEEKFLSPLAMHSKNSKGRAKEEKEDPIRTIFMRDRDRIIHAKAFRRLKHKTQVFISPGNDHYRTRLTHTLEVMQIAKSIGRALRFNQVFIQA